MLALNYDLHRVFMPWQYPPLYEAEIVMADSAEVRLRGHSYRTSEVTEVKLRRVE